MLGKICKRVTVRILLLSIPLPIALNTIAAAEENSDSTITSQQPQSEKEEGEEAAQLPTVCTFGSEEISGVEGAQLPFELQANTPVTNVILTVPVQIQLINATSDEHIALSKVSETQWQINTRSPQTQFNLAAVTDQAGNYVITIEDQQLLLKITAGPTEGQGDDSKAETDVNLESSANSSSVFTVDTFEKLQAAINNAPDNQEKTIQITASFAFKQTITIPKYKIITLIADEEFLLTNPTSEYCRHHFHVVDGQLTLKHHITLDGGGVYSMGESGLFRLAGGIIQNGILTDEGNAVNIEYNGKIQIIDGIIRQSSSPAVYIWTGTLEMLGGTIENNANAGVFLVDKNSKFDMRDGRIANNNSAGVLMRGGNFNMFGGTISNNKAGLQLAAGYFEMNGGSIEQNSSSTTGGGVRVGAAAKAVFNSGAIINNHSGIHGGGIGFEHLTKEQVIKEAVTFSGNTSSKSYHPPIDVETVFPNILSRNSSLTTYTHPLNGFDVGYIASDPQFINVKMSKNIDKAGFLKINKQPYTENVLMATHTRTTIEAIPEKGYAFIEWQVTSSDGPKRTLTTASTTLDVEDSDVTVQAIFKRMPVAPVDPLDPETDINPENKPDIPEEQGPLSIDFVPQFTFGEQKISAQDAVYYAEPQKIATVDQNINRPNYVQISDRRSTDGDGWTLSVTQNKPFTNENGHQLNGALLTLHNQAVVSTESGERPEIINKDVVYLEVNARSPLLSADEAAGKGTWVYRFGDEQTQSKSVALYVPMKATPQKGTYTTTLTWELSNVPKNE